MCACLLFDNLYACTDTNLIENYYFVKPVTILQTYCVDTEFIEMSSVTFNKRMLLKNDDDDDDDEWKTLQERASAYSILNCAKAIFRF